MRIEKDYLGEKRIPQGAFYGIHTMRSIENFRAGGETIPLEIIYAMAKIKASCALANVQLGLLADEKAHAIVKACEKVLSGICDDQFPIDVFQAGSGTSTHMNVNEVIAALAAINLGGSPGDLHIIHPNDHVNKGQSTNNVFPSAIRMAVVDLYAKLKDQLEGMIKAFEEKAKAFHHVIKSGRTHLQDAVPITLGQEFAAFSHALGKTKKRLERACEGLNEVGVGGNAVGTGINTKPEFRELIIQVLNQNFGCNFKTAENNIEMTQFMTDMGEMSGMLRLLALDILKITNDIRLLGSGPNTGIGEIRLPAVEPGSSIMPGKINPSICEAANMACMQVVGYDAAIAMAVGAGQLELNTHMPLIGANLVKQIKILTRTAAMLSEKCIQGIEADVLVCRKHFENSSGLATLLNPALGYDQVAKLVKEGLETGKPLKDQIMEKKLMTEAEFEELLKGSTKPNL